MTSKPLLTTNTDINNTHQYFCFHRGHRPLYLTQQPRRRKKKKAKTIERARERARERERESNPICRRLHMLNFHVFFRACLPSHGLRRCLPILLLLFFSDCGGLVSATCCRKRSQVAPAPVPAAVRQSVAKKPAGSAKVASAAAASTSVVAAVNSTRLGTTLTSRETRRSTTVESPGEAEQDLDRDVLVSDDPHVTSGGQKKQSRTRTGRKKRLEKEEEEGEKKDEKEEDRFEQGAQKRDDGREGRAFEQSKEDEKSRDKALEWAAELSNGTVSIFLLFFFFSFYMYFVLWESLIICCKR